MDFYSRVFSVGSMTAIVLFILVGCSEQLTPDTSQTGQSSAENVVNKQLVIFQSKGNAWQVAINNDKYEQPLEGDTAELRDASAHVQYANKDGADDALLFRFKDHWSTGIFLTKGRVDLTEFIDQGTLEFDLRIDDIQNGKLDLLLACEENCRHRYRLREWAQKYEKKGWQHLSLPISCLLADDMALSQTSAPFYLNTGGNGQIALANVVVNSRGTANMPCPSAVELATRPATLNEYWSVDWWLPRHAKKLAQANLAQAELVMIGDSITHGWENAGKEVWNRYFSDVNTLNLGYGGDRTENVLWRLQHGELGKTQPKLIVIMIGTNNTGHRMDPPDAIAAGVSAILDELASRVPKTKILLLSIFPRDANPDSAMRKNNLGTSQLLKVMAEQRDVLFANFNQAFLTNEGVLSKEIMPDLLHPQAKGYEIWAKQLTPYIDQYVRDK